MKEYTFKVRAHLIGEATVTVTDGDYDKAVRQVKCLVSSIDSDKNRDEWTLWSHPHRTEAEITLEPIRIIDPAEAQELDDDPITEFNCDDCGHPLRESDGNVWCRACQSRRDKDGA